MGYRNRNRLGTNHTQNNAKCGINGKYITVDKEKRTIKDNIIYFSTLIEEIFFPQNTRNDQDYFHFCGKSVFF